MAQPVAVGAEQHAFIQFQFCGVPVTQERSGRRYILLSGVAVVEVEDRLMEDTLAVSAGPSKVLDGLLLGRAVPEASI